MSSSWDVSPVTSRGHALQDAYLDASRHIGDFRGASQLATWLTRIVINQALMRLRRRKRDRVVVPFGERRAPGRDGPPTQAEAGVADETIESPPGAVLRAEIRRLLERRIDDLPVAFRTVFVMRDVEEMSVQETADGLSIPVSAVIGSSPASSRARTRTPPTSRAYPERSRPPQHPSLRSPAADGWPPMTRYAYEYRFTYRSSAAPGHPGRRVRLAAPRTSMAVSARVSPRARRCRPGSRSISVRCPGSWSKRLTLNLSAEETADLVEYLKSL
jgi:RNA polymerase sigma factor (sigma-70 family)